MHAKANADVSTLALSASESLYRHSLLLWPAGLESTACAVVV